MARVAELIAGDGEKIVAKLREWLGVTYSAGDATGAAGTAVRELRLVAAQKSIENLAAASTIDEVGGALTELAESLRGAPSAQIAIERERALAKLHEVECVSGPARLVDAHLTPVGAPAAPALTETDDPSLAAEPQSTAALLADLVAAIKRYIYLPDEAAVWSALWVLHSWAIEAAEFSPRLIVKSPTKRCGKSLLLDLLQSLCRAPLMTSNTTPASIFRVVEAESPTLLLDEVDTFLHGHDELRGVLNAGFSRATGFVTRVNPETLEPEKFRCFAPVACASIGALPDTVEDRGFSLAMQRKPRTHVLPKLRRPEREALRALRPRLARWAQDHMPLLSGGDPPVVPEALNDRQADVAEPLLAIADLAGDEWPRQSRDSALALAGATVDETDVGERLLAALKRMFYPVAEPGATPLPPIERLTFS